MTLLARIRRQIAQAEGSWPWRAAWSSWRGLMFADRLSATTEQEIG